MMMDFCTIVSDTKLHHIDYKCRFGLNLYCTLYVRQNNILLGSFALIAFCLDTLVTHTANTYTHTHIQKHAI